MRFLSFEIARSGGSFLLNLTVSIVSPYALLCLSADNTHIIPYESRVVKRGERKLVILICVRAGDITICGGTLCGVSACGWGVYSKMRLGCFPVSWVVSVCAV